MDMVEGRIRRHHSRSDLDYRLLYIFCALPNSIGQDHTRNSSQQRIARTHFLKPIRVAKIVRSSVPITAYRIPFNLSWESAKLVAAMYPMQCTRQEPIQVRILRNWSLVIAIVILILNFPAFTFSATPEDQAPDSNFGFEGGDGSTTESDFGFEGSGHSKEKNPQLLPTWEERAKTLSGSWVSADGTFTAKIENGVLTFHRASDWTDLMGEDFVIKEKRTFATGAGHYRIIDGPVTTDRLENPPENLTISFNTGEPFGLKESFDLYREEDEFANSLSPVGTDNIPSHIQKILHRIAAIKVGETVSTVLTDLGLKEEELEFEYYPLGTGMVEFKCYLDEKGEWELRYKTSTLPWSRAKDDRMLWELEVNRRNLSHPEGKKIPNSSRAFYPRYTARPYENSGLIVTSRTEAHRADRLEYHIDIPSLIADLENEFAIQILERDRERIVTPFSACGRVSVELISNHRDRVAKEYTTANGLIDRQKMFEQALPILAKHCRVDEDKLEVHAFFVD